MYMRRRKVSMAPSRRNKLSLALFVLIFILASAIGVNSFLRSIYVVPVLMYHSIDFTDDRANKLVVLPESFTRQMEFLQKNNYNVISAEELVNLIEENAGFPAKTVAITFDDGYANNYKYAYPVLRLYGLPATIFVITDKIGEEGYLSRDQIEEMVESGIITIGSHTMSHAWLPGLDEGQLIRELVDSKKALEAGTGGKVEFISYPLGGYNDNVKESVKRAGYKGAFATNPGKSERSDDRYLIKRVRISNTSDNLFVFLIESSGYYTWIKEHRDED